MIISFLLQLIFPRRCPVCDRIVISFGEKICTECLGKLRLLTPPWCMRCGKKLASEKELCEDCKERKHHYLRCRNLYEYGSIAPSIYRFKYSGRREYGDFYGEEMARYLGEYLRECRADALIPVPLHRKRLAKRGYNQALVLAKALSRHTGIPVRADLLRRVKNTAPLKYQNPAQRQNNLKKAFNIVQNDVKLKTVILVDDIYTTGSTMDEAAAVLKQHGVRCVFGVTLAGGAGI